MAIQWSEAVVAELDRLGIEPALVQRALAAPDEVRDAGPPGEALHALRYWDLAANREMWLRVRVGEAGAVRTILGAEKQPVYPEQ